MKHAQPYDRSVVVQQPTTIEDALGTEVETWTTLGDPVPARRLTQRAVEAWKAGGTAAQREIVFRAPWSPTLAALIDSGARWRLVENGQVLPISGVVEVGRREGLEITTNPSGQAA